MSQQELDGFFEAGLLRDRDGLDYSILVPRWFSPSKQGVILKKILSGESRLRRHVYVPERLVVGQGQISTFSLVAFLRGKAGVNDTEIFL